MPNVVDIIRVALSSDFCVLTEARREADEVTAQ